MYLPQKPFIEHNLDQSCVCRTAFYDPVFVAFLLHWTMHTFVVLKVTAWVRHAPFVFIYDMVDNPTPHLLKSKGAINIHINLLQDLITYGLMNEVRSIFQFQSEQQQIRYILYAVQISTHHEAVYICGIGTRVPKVVDNVSAPS